MSTMSDAICNKCCNPAALMCQRCHETYCSTDCQILDWKEHKSKCYQMPTLVPIRKVLSRCNSTNSKTCKTLDDSCLSEPHGGTAMRQPHKRSNDSYRSRNDSGSTNHSHSRHASQSENRRETPVVLLEDNDFALKPKLMLKQETSTPDCSKGAIPKRFTTAEKAPWMSPFLPPVGSYFEAIVQWLEDDQHPGVIWVTERKYEDELKKVLLYINRNINKTSSCSIGEIQVGSLLAAPLDGIYYRAEVLSVNNSSKLAHMRLIDYGNQLQVPFAELRSGIAIMHNLNAYAIRVQLPEGFSSKQQLNVDDVINLRVLRAETVAGTFKAELKEATVPLELPLDVLASKPEMLLLKVLNEGEHALLQFASLKDCTAEMNEKMRSEKGIAFDFDAEELPVEGAFVAARTLQGWRRASLLGHCAEIASYLVYLIDEGRVGMCKQLKKIPEAFMALPIRSVAISIASCEAPLNESKLMKVGKLTLRVLGSATPPRKNIQSLPCTLFANDEKIADVAVSSFAGNIEEFGIKYWPERVANGGIVHITNVLTQAEICISSSSCKDYPALFTTLASQCTPFEAKDVIKAGDIVLARMADGKSFCRAKVLSQNSNGAFRVLNIDAGSYFEVSRDFLRKPNLFVRSSPVFMNRVKLIYLEKISTPIANNKALATLQQCQANGVEFIVKYDANDPEVVDLFMRTDEQQSLSKQLLPLLFEKSSYAVAPSKSSANDDSCSVKTSNAIDEMALPPSPPHTPKIKNQPIEFTKPLQTLKSTISSKDSAISLPNLNIEKIKTDAAGKMYTLEDLEIIGIQNGDNMPLTVLDASTIEKGYITACDFSNKESLKLMDANLERVKKHGKCPHLERNYEPRKTEICLALFKDDDEWYRALCVNILKDGKFLIMFLDYGNMCVVSKHECLPIVKDLMFPSNANLCYIEDCPRNLTKQQINSFLGKTLSDPIMSCNVSRQEDDTYNIKIHNLEKYFH